MKLPIVAYGAAVLRKKCEEITADYPALDKLLEDMWETMYNSNGVGLAAPQINKPIRLFVIDSAQIIEDLEEEELAKYPNDEGYKGVFINAKITSLQGEEWAYNEGCLSIPGVREDIYRNQIVTLDFYNEKFELQTKSFNGITARVILHEYDHIEGKLFIDYLKPLRKTLLKRRLTDISKGKVDVDYRMVFSK